ncbi:MAG: LLM class flavin-dependent oxidoreductase [Trueperaceae bacterium]|nr:LLM class flavin-dependent oxidoreductase [Trueperaceae bacterium]
MAKPVRFSLFLQPIHSPKENPTVALERDLKLIEWLDELNFDEVFVGEHHSSGWQYIASPEIFMATAAARTKRIKLGSGVIPLSVHNPLYVAENFALLDHLTRGRVILGMGPGGGLKSDPYVLGLDPSKQSERFLQALDVIMHLLTSVEPLTIKTDWFELNNAVLQLRPYSYPHMPLALVTGANEATLERIGKHGTRWLVGGKPEQLEANWQKISAAASKAGKTADKHDVYVPVNLHLAETREQALENIREGSSHERFDFSTRVSGSPLPPIDRDAWPEHLSSRPTDIIGSPDDAIEKLGQLLAATGAGSILITIKEWANREATWKSFELFARYVMPQFQGSLRNLASAEEVAINYTLSSKG